MSFKKDFFKNLMVSGGYNYIAQGISFLSSIIIARLLSPNNYGVVGLITVFTGFISVFADSGISLAVIKSNLGTAYHKSLDSLSLIMGLLLFVLTAALAYPISVFYNNPIIILPTIVLGLTFITRSMVLVRSALVIKALNFNLAGKILLINTIVTVILTIILAYAGAEHWALILPQLATSLLSIVLYERYLKFGFDFSKIKYIIVSFKHTKQIIGSLIGFNLVNYWSRNSDNLIVGKVYGTTELGIYNRAYSLLTLPLALITGLIGAVLFPSLNKLKNSGKEIHAEYLFVLKAITFIVFPVAFIFIVFPKELVSILWGQNWIQVADILPYFGLLIISQSLLSTTGNVLVLQGKEKVLMFSGWVSAFFIISGIAIGAYYSLVATAQVYSLFFIVFVLPFNLTYVFQKSLGFGKKQIYTFWLPIIIMSLLIWIACYLNLTYLKVMLLLCLLVIYSVSFRKEASKLIVMIKQKLLSKNNPI